MRDALKLGIQLLLLPATLLTTDSGIPSSSHKGTAAEDLTGDNMSPAVRKAFDDAQADAIKAAQAEMAGEAEETEETASRPADLDV